MTASDALHYLLMEGIPSPEVVGATIEPFDQIVAAGIPHEVAAMKRRAGDEERVHGYLIPGANECDILAEGAKQWTKVPIATQRLVAEVFYNFQHGSFTWYADWPEWFFESAKLAPGKGFVENPTRELYDYVTFLFLRPHDHNDDLDDDDFDEILTQLQGRV